MFQRFAGIRDRSIFHTSGSVQILTDFHVLNNLLLVDEVVMTELARIVLSFRCSVRDVWVRLNIHAFSSSLLSHPSTSGKNHKLRPLHMFSCILLQGWLELICWSCWFSTRGCEATPEHPPLEETPESLNFVCVCLDARGASVQIPWVLRIFIHCRRRMVEASVKSFWTNMPLLARKSHLAGTAGK